jgi:hypothetical protein
MGYTHYFTQLKSVSDEQWKTLVEASKKALWRCSTVNRKSDKKLRICNCLNFYLIKDPDELEIISTSPLSRPDCEFIGFNGSRRYKEDFEDFMFPQNAPLGEFNCCKTGRKPYDWLVVAVLILADNLCPGCYEITSDGNAEDWQPVLDWLNEGRDEKYALPSRIRSRKEEEVSNA